MSANSKQVGGTHYGGGAVQHWDVVVMHQLNYFEGQIIKYVMRCRKKHGKQDLEKARHFIDKYLEVYDALLHAPAPQVSEEEQARRSGLVIEGFIGPSAYAVQCAQCGTRQQVTALDPHCKDRLK